MKKNKLFMMLAICLMAISIPFVAADYYTYATDINGASVIAVNATSKTINPGSDTLLGAFTSMTPTANFSVAVADSFIGNTTNRNSSLNWYTPVSPAATLTMTAAGCSLVIANSTDVIDLNSTKNSVIVMGLQEKLTAFTTFTPRLNFSKMVNETLSGGSNGSYSVLTWLSRVNFTSWNGTGVIQGVNITNTTGVDVELDPSNFTLTNITANMWIVTWNENTTGQTFTVTMNRTWVKTEDDLVTLPNNTINRDVLGLTYFVAYSLGGYGDDVQLNISAPNYGHFINGTDWSVGWNANDTTCAIVPATNYTVLSAGGYAWVINWSSTTYDGRTIDAAYNKTFIHGTDDIVTNASGMRVGATTANFLTQSTPTAYDEDKTYSMNGASYGAYPLNQNWDILWSETNRTNVVGAMSTEASAGMSNVRALTFAAFGLIAIIILVSIAFGLVQLIQYGNFDLMTITVTAIAGAILLFVAFFIINAVYRGLGGL